MAEGSHVGRPSSWMTVSVMVVGFAIGGVGLVAGPSWPLFWAGGAVAAVGGVLALAVGIFSDVVIYSPRDITAGTDGMPGADGTEVRAGTTETAPAPREEAPGSDPESPENSQDAKNAENAENLASG